MIRILLAATLLVSACAAPAGQPAPGPGRTTNVELVIHKSGP